jgi:hypothetical protein
LPVELLEMQATLALRGLEVVGVMAEVAEMERR